ncbi:hypothetical protein BX600DRAFT_258247 [Xylariales sp. PMI_506]|nr:hypothetical protein BX600DRAFT_258247 [Xylariales sp. PMI_506]
MPLKSLCLLFVLLYIEFHTFEVEWRCRPMIQSPPIHHLHFNPYCSIHNEQHVSRPFSCYIPIRTYVEHNIRLIQYCEYIWVATSHCVTAMTSIRKQPKY